MLPSNAHQTIYLWIYLHTTYIQSRSQKCISNNKFLNCFLFWKIIWWKPLPPWVSPKKNRLKLVNPTIATIKNKVLFYHIKVTCEFIKIKERKQRFLSSFCIARSNRTTMNLIFFLICQFLTWCQLILKNWRIWKIQHYGCLIRPNDWKKLNEIFACFP